MKTHLCIFRHPVDYKGTKMKEKPTNIKHNGWLPTQTGFEPWSMVTVNQFKKANIW